MAADRLTIMALRALEEAGRDCLSAPVPRSWGLRLALAYLHQVGRGDRWCFDDFWKNATREAGPNSDAHAQGIGRSQAVNACLNGIYRQVGVERTTEMMMPVKRAR